PIDQLKLNPKNPRAHRRRQIRQIAESMRTFGFIVPVVVDSELNVIAGHGRVMAGRLLGWAEVPTTQLGHLSEAQIKAYTIADNRLTDNSTWDKRLLAEQLKEIAESELDFSLEVTGFDMGDIDVHIEGLAAPPVDDDPADAVPEPRSGPPISKIG